MKKQLLVIFVLFLWVCSVAQQKQIDSLIVLLNKHKTADTTRLHILNSLSYHYQSVNSEKGIDASNEAITIAQALNYQEQLARAYLNKAYNYINSGKDSLALKLFYKSLDIAVSKHHSEGSAKAFGGIARIHQNWSEYDKAIEFYKKANHIFELKKDYLSMAKMLNGIGICYMYSSNYPKALDYLIQTSHLYEQANQYNTLGYAAALNNIGLIYARMEVKLKLSLEYYQKALKIYKQNNNKIGIANTLGNMANTYDNLNNPQKAIELQKEVYSIYESIGNKIGMASALTNIGIAYTSIPNYLQSIYYLEQTLPIYKELGNKNNLGIVAYYLGEVYLELPNNNINIAKAKNHLEQALNLSKETNNIQTQADVLNTLSKLYVKNNDYKKALTYKELATTLKDSLTSQDLKDEITRLEVKYEYDKKANLVKAEHDKQQALAQAEIKRQKIIKNGAVIGGSSLLIMAFFGLLLYKRKRDAVAQKQEAEFNTKVANTELKALRAQMNPHFIFNSLNSINDYILKNDVEAASNYLTKFAKIMRQTLENSNQLDISLEDDLKVLDLYLQVERMRLRNKFTYNISIDETIDAENTLIPPFILQPFIENSIWHGISKKETDGHIKIQIKKDKNMLVCTVDDNGVGRPLQAKNNVNQTKSLGISITQSRIDIINKKKNTHGSLKMIDKDQGVRVEIKLPFQLAF